MTKYKKTDNCLICNTPIFAKTANRLCIKCYREKCDNEKIQHWKETGDTGCKVSTTIRSVIRTYILNKQNCRCAICNTKNEWLGKPLNFVLDHIDGNASNNFESNLRLICPNCDSQLDTFKSKNKNSARNHRKQYN